MADTPAPAPAPLPDAISLPGGAGCNEAAPYAVQPGAGQIVLRVGPGEAYATIAAAVSAAANGDLILVAPGTYLIDFADITAQITIAGAGGMVNLVASEAPPNEKGIFVVDNSCEIDNLSFSGAAIADSLGGNAAGLRYQGGNLVLHNDAFMDNQNGILAAAVDGLAQNTVTILQSTFDANGQSSGPNAGYTHNCYISTGITSLVAQGDVFERANMGHELKSRAGSNLIADNIFYDGPDGTASYSIDLPDGGADTVRGNVIEKGPATQNSAIIHFGGEGIPYAGSALSVQGNRIINDRGAACVAVLNQTTQSVAVTGNEFDNFTGATLASGVYAQSGNRDQNGNPIAASTSSQIAPGTPGIDFSGDALAHTVTLTTATFVRGGGGLLSVAARAGHVTVLGGAGGLRYTEAPGWGGSYIATAAGAADTVTAPGQDTVLAEGHDAITGGAANLTVQVDGSATIASGAGDNAYVVNGAASIAGHGGSDTVQVNAAGAAARVGGSEAYFQAAVNGGTLAFAFSQDGAPAQATVTGAAALRVYNGGMNVTTAGGTAGANIVFGAGTVTACVSAGPDTLHAGSGAEDLIVSASAKIYAGSGALSVFGRSETGTATVYGAAGHVLIGGDTGDIVYQGGAAANTVNAALSNISVLGGTGLMTVQGGSDQTVQGGKGGLVFSTAGGADVIATLAGAHDTVSFTQACSLISNGFDVIGAGAGNSTVTANGAASITGSSGAAFYTLNGADTLQAYGYSRVTVGAAGHAAIANQGSLISVTDQGGVVVFSQQGTAGAASATVTGGAVLSSGMGAGQTVISLTGQGSAATLGGGHAAVAMAAFTRVEGGAGAASVAVSAGGCTVQAGAGALSVAMQDWVDQAATTIIGGAGPVAQSSGFGNLEFIGGAGTAVLGGTANSETVLAGAGNITLAGGGSGTYFTAGAGGAQISLTSGGGTIVFGAGATAVTEAGWGNAVIYDFNSGSGGGSDTINGFRGGTDQLVFNGVTVAQQTTVGGAMQLILSDGTHVALIGRASF